jgi:hypothetical protein
MKKWFRAPGCAAAIAEYNEAIRLDPACVWTRNNLEKYAD